MFKRAKPDGHLDREIKRTTFKMNEHEPDSAEYGVLVERLSKLRKLRAEAMQPLVNPETALTTAAYLVGMVMIIHHERVSVITTKAMSYLPKPK